jgi:hypothetical protein
MSAHPQEQHHKQQPASGQLFLSKVRCQHAATDHITLATFAFEIYSNPEFMHQPSGLQQGLACSCFCLSAFQLAALPDDEAAEEAGQPAKRLQPGQKKNPINPVTGAEEVGVTL